MDAIVNMLNSYIDGGSANTLNLGVARYMLAHYDELPGLRLQDIAEACYTSNPTVIRLVRSFGFADYSAFREAVRVERAWMEERADFGSLAPLLDGEAMSKDAIHAWVGALADSLEVALDCMDTDALRRLVTDIMRYRYVYLLGRGRSKLFGDYLADTLAYCGKVIGTYRDIDRLADALRQNEENLVIVVSQQGNLLEITPDVFDRLRSPLSKTWLITQMPAAQQGEGYLDEMGQPDDVLYAGDAPDTFVLLALAKLVRQLYLRMRMGASNE